MSKETHSMQKISITDFFNTDYVDQASYDNLRKIASLVDGQKNAARKILYTILEKNIKDEIKVSQLGSKVSEFAEYLHGSLDGVVVGLAQNFPGSNNIPLLMREGNFGTRFANEASASRYIYTYGAPEFFELFNKEDSPILEHQVFEGHKIEPKFYVPSLPLLLINGSEGVSSGFAQKILPRDPKKIKQHIENILQGKPSRYKFEPYFEGFNGEVQQGEHSSQWLIKGKVTVQGINKVLIEEVPVGYDLRGYINILDKLEDDKIIQSYRDKSENDKFKFEVTIPSKTLKSWDHETLLTKLKLIKKVSENYTVIDENNKIQVLESAQEIIEKYIQVKLTYMEKRRLYMIEKIKEDIRFNFSKYKFIKMIVDDELVVNKRKKKEIVQDLENVNVIIPMNDSYDYLLNMAIHSLTEERMKKLEDEIKAKKQELDKLEKTSNVELWLNEI